MRRKIERSTGSGSLSDTAAVDWDQITGRPPFVLNTEAVRRRVQGRVVVVTGAAGSLGAPLSRALAAAGPARLILLDSHEATLFVLRESLSATEAGVNPATSLRAVLADVRDTARLRRLWQQDRPDLVFHLAAYKHVPWGEEDPEAFVTANVLGARSVIEAARDSGVAQLVYPSTDKAIDPPSLYGATKRLVEAMLYTAAATGGPRCTVVRFVNVLGSRGSAPEKFARQLRASQPLSVTDRAMRRYWITPQHACLLLLHAACLDEPAVTVTPDAGEEITVLEIARRLAQALRPDRPAPEIAVTGARPGERLSEPITAPYERLEPVGLPGILAVRGGGWPSSAAVQAAVDRLEHLLGRGADSTAVRAALFAELSALQFGSPSGSGHRAEAPLPTR